MLSEEEQIIKYGHEYKCEKNIHSNSTRSDKIYEGPIKNYYE